MVKTKQYTRDTLCEVNMTMFYSPMIISYKVNVPFVVENTTFSNGLSLNALWSCFSLEDDLSSNLKSMSGRQLGRKLKQLA